MNKKTLITLLLLGGTSTLGALLFIKNAPPPILPLTYAPMKTSTNKLIIQTVLSIPENRMEFLEVAPADIFIGEPKELIATVKHSDYCGNSGCMYAIFKKTKGRLKLVNIFFGETFEIQDELHNGARKVLINGTRIMRWNKESYEDAPPS